MKNAIRTGAAGQPWKAFALLVVTYFITIVDFTIVNVALPAIGRELRVRTDRSRRHPHRLRTHPPTPEGRRDRDRTVAGPRDGRNQLRGQWLMMFDHWPLFGLRVTTPRLELRAPSDAELSELADLAAEGMHEPGRRPFLVSWPDLPPQERARALLQRHWRHRADWSADDWSLDLAVFADGQVVGEQDMSAHDYPVLREVSTFSWVGVRHHGRGIGTEMRAAALHLAFAGLGATDAVSGAFADNLSSLRVSEKLGYQADGIERLAAHGQVTITHRLRLTRERWEAADRVPVTITGLEPCLPLFGQRGDGAG